MLHPELAAHLRKRLEIIRDQQLRERDPAAQLEALKAVSNLITDWHAGHRGNLPPRLEHFLTNCSYDKALTFLESDGEWAGH